MWLSKLVLDARSKAARRDLGNPYEMHRTLCRAVARGMAEGRERLLWRAEPVRSYERPVVLVQTWTEPDWSVLEPGYAEVFPAKRFEPVLHFGDRFQFRLRANPVKRSRETRKRVALKTREEKLTWLARQLAEGGFALPQRDGRYMAEIWQDSYLEITRGGTTVQLQAVLFEGLVEVVEPERAVRTLASGIGSGKAFGLGLLSLKRA